MRTPERVRTVKREYMRKARLNPEKRERWNRLRREKWASRYAQQQYEYGQRLKEKHFFRWRARNWRHGKVTAIELARLWKAQRGLCALSGRKLGRDAHLDHIVAKANGGHGGLANLRWLDPTVNVMRAAMSDKEFGLYCSQIAQWIAERIKQVIADFPATPCTDEVSSGVE